MKFQKLLRDKYYGMSVLTVTNISLFVKIKNNRETLVKIVVESTWADQASPINRVAVRQMTSEHVISPKT